VKLGGGTWVDPHKNVLDGIWEGELQVNASDRSALLQDEVNLIQCIQRDGTKKKMKSENAAKRRGPRERSEESTMAEFSERIFLTDSRIDTTKEASEHAATANEHQI